MDDRRFNGWSADIARAFIVWVLYAVGGYITFVAVWIFSWPGLALFISTVFFGPFLAARFACRLIPADRPLAPTLGWGFLLGLIFFLFLGFGVLKIAEQRHAEGNYTRIFAASVFGGPVLVAVLFSRLKRWSSD